MNAETILNAKSYHLYDDRTRTVFCVTHDLKSAIKMAELENHIGFYACTDEDDGDDYALILLPEAKRILKLSQL